MTRPTPAMFDHAVKVYEAMRAEAAYELPEGEVEAADGSGIIKPEPELVYTGHLTTLFQKLELAMPYYTAVMKGLKALNCVEQLRRGGGNAESKWILLEPPSEEGWVAYEENKRGHRPQGKLEAHAQRIQNHEERLTHIEEYLATLRS